MVKSLVYICFIFVLFGCSSTKHPQPKSIDIYSSIDLRKKQFIDLFETIKKTGSLEAVNKYRLATLEKIESFDSDTIIYYEQLYSPILTIGKINYISNLYESKNKTYHSYKKEFTILDIIYPVTKDPLNPTRNITIVNMESISTSYYFKQFIAKMKKEGWQKDLKVDLQVVGSQNHGNTLVVAIKVGGIYRFKLYKEVFI